MMVPTCLNCGKTDEEKPLVMLRYKSMEIHICPQCLPILIHEPEKLDSTLEKYGPPDHQHGHTHESAA